MTTPQSDRDQAAANAADDTSLVENAHPMSSYPAFPGKQMVLAVSAAVLLITMFLPWWDAEIPLNRVADTLNGWLLFGAGLSIGSLGATTGYTWFGNALFGLVPTLPVIVLAVLLVLRVLRVYVAPASTLFLYSLFASIGSVWLLVFGTLRINASNGSYPVMAGPWIVLVVSIALAVLCLLWWRTERIHFPTHRWMGVRSGTVDEAPVVAGTDDLFAGIDDNDAVEDAPLSMGGGLGLGIDERDRGRRSGDADANEGDELDTGRDAK